jgi:hypothetical protein
MLQRISFFVEVPDAYFSAKDTFRLLDLYVVAKNHLEEHIANAISMEHTLRPPKEDQS